MYKCKNCLKEFEKRHAYIGHCRLHSDKVKNRIPKVKIEKKHICTFCTKEFSQGYQLGGHIAHCMKNPNRIKTHKGAPHTEETKRKISQIRRAYLEKNPDKVPYLMNHSSQESYPEKLVRIKLEELNLDFECQYRNGIYSYDFAWPEKKIDIEIDGGTHTQEKVRKIDRRRDQWSSKQGWTIHRFSAIMVKQDLDQVIDQIQQIVT